MDGVCLMENPGAVNQVGVWKNIKAFYLFMKYGGMIASHHATNANKELQCIKKIKG